MTFKAKANYILQNEKINCLTIIIWGSLFKVLFAFKYKRWKEVFFRFLNMFFSSKLKRFKNLKHCFFSRKNGVSKGYVQKFKLWIGIWMIKKKMF